MIKLTIGGVLAAALVAALPSCSSVEAKVGAPQGACGIDAGAPGPAMSGSSYYPVGTRQTPAAATCAGNTGSSCDDCESAHCCSTRSACYGDPVCACADLALDHCLDDASAAVADRNTQCWNTFSAAGNVEQARIACQRSWCQMECGVP
jgi:hypothetical protein